MSDEYVHEVVDHAIEYVRDHVHTNGIENFWSLLKHTVKGTYVSVEPQHLNKYVNEQTFRYNEKDGTNQDRFLELINGIFGKRLTYSELIGYDRPATV